MFYKGSIRVLKGFRGVGASGYFRRVPSRAQKGSSTSSRRVRVWGLGFWVFGFWRLVC